MAHSPSRSAIDIGTVVDQTYQIEALLGRGGMGSVFLASHLRLPGKQVAIKVLHADLAADDVLARFRREAHISSELDHPNIVTVHDTNSLPDGTPYLVMEYLVGENLAQRIAAGPMATDDVLAIVRQIAAALTAAHEAGIVHRDLKPQNIFLVPTEVAGVAVEHVKVLDFGISKMRASQTVQTQDSTMLGTPQYMAPEQATGRHAEVDARTDLFALGAIVYEMLCGQPAFTGASVPEVVFKVVYEEPVPLAERVPHVAPEIAAAVQRALAKPAADRFPTAAAFVAALTGKPAALTRAPRARSQASAATTGRENTDAITTQDALAETVGSGDHGPPPIAVAETLTSGDRGLRAPSPDTAAAPPPPMVPASAATAVEPPRRRRWLLVAGVIALASAIALGVVIGRRSRRGRRTTAVATAPIDASLPPPVALDAPRADDRPDAPAAAATVPDAAPVIAEPRPDARAQTSPRARPDAAPPATSPEADRIYANGLRVLAKDPARAAQYGNRLNDVFHDPRGWVLVGAASCAQNALARVNEARGRLKRHPALLAEMNRRCQ